MRAPVEAQVLAAAREWGVPPWVIEAECSERWWLWYVADNNARVEAEKARQRERGAK